MNDQAKTILWLGFIMIALQIVKDWPVIRNAIFGGQGGALGSGIPLIVPPGTNPETPPAEEPPPEEAPPEEPPGWPGLPVDVPVVAAFSRRTG